MVKKLNRMDTVNREVHSLTHTVCLALNKALLHRFVFPDLTEEEWEILQKAENIMKREHSKTWDSL